MSYENICHLILSRVKSTADDDGDMPKFQNIVNEMTELLTDAEALGFTNLAKMGEMSRRRYIETRC